MVASKRNDGLRLLNPKCGRKKRFDAVLDEYLGWGEVLSILPKEKRRDDRKNNHTTSQTCILADETTLIQMKEVRKECERRTNSYIPFDSLPEPTLVRDLNYSPPFTPNASGPSSTSESTSSSLLLSNPNAGLWLKKGYHFVGISYLYRRFSRHFTGYHLDVLGLVFVRFSCDLGSGPEDGGIGSSLRVATCAFSGLFDIWSPRVYKINVKLSHKAK